MDQVLTLVLFTSAIPGCEEALGLYPREQLAGSKE